MNLSRSPTRLPIIAVMAVVIVVLGWLLFGFAGSRERVVALPDKAGSTVEYLAQETGAATADEVARRPQEDWRVWSGDGYVRGGLNGVLWLRVTLRNPTARELRGVMENVEYFIDRADAWLAEGDTWLRLRSGEAVSAREKVLPGREIAWPVTVPAAGERVVYLRFDNVPGIFGRLQWWPEERDFHAARARSGLAEGVYIGGLMALLGYTSLLWLRLRAADFGYYVLYLASVAVFILLARGQVITLGWALNVANLTVVLAVAMALGTYFLTAFARTFLDSATYFPRADRVVRTWGLAMVVLALLAAASPWMTPPGRWLWLATLAVGSTHAGLMVLAVATWRAGGRQARFFVLSFGCLFAGSLPMAGMWFYNSPLQDAAMRGLMVGSALEMLLLSLALADRFARTQHRLVEETEQRRMIEAAYADELAEEVRERTRELQDANADKDRMLAVIGHDLRGPLTGLMRSADAESGALARETARTGRELLLMIEDLVLWARLRAGGTVTAAYPAEKLTGPAAALHRALAAHGGIELVVDVPEELTVATDLVLAQTLLRNLLANALKFAATRVELRACAQANGGVRFTVVNDGATLPPEMAGRFRANENEPITATGGLGLRLCREICSALGTRLEAGPREAGGTEFGFTLKAAATTKEDVL